MERMRFHIVGFDGDGQPHTLRRFSTRERADTYLGTTLHRRFRDVHLVEREEEIIQPRPEGMPPFPWSVEWVSGFAYVVDADGRKIASLLGAQHRREAMAEFICNLKAS